MVEDTDPTQLDGRSDFAGGQSEPVVDNVWLPIAEAARRLGLSRDGVLKRVRRGRLIGRLEDGRWLVQMPAEDETEAGPEREAKAEHIHELREEVTFLRGLTEAQQRQIEQDAVERAELRRLLGNAQQQLQALLPAPSERGSGESTATLAPSGWRAFRQDKRGLGASLTLTGLVAVLAGIALHLALQHQFIESEVHLGYIIGLVGLLTLLIGLVIVF